MRNQLSVSFALLFGSQACAEIQYAGEPGGGGASQGGGSGTQTSSATSGGGGAAEGGAGAAGGAGGGATSTSTGMGGSTPQLVDQGLVVRYFLDETDSGSPVGALVMDAAPQPLDLPVTWPVSGTMFYTSVDGQRGLQSVEVGSEGRASIPLAGTKLRQQLQGSTTGTIELVVEVFNVHMSNSRLLHIGTADESGRFSLSAGTTDELNFFWHDPTLNDDVLAGHWPLPLAASGRCVLHLVLDTTEAVPVDRVRLYRDGVLFNGNDGVLPAPGQSLVFADGHHFALFNREIGARTFEGALYYAAVYSSALTQAEVASNALLLLANDDTP